MRVSSPPLAKARLRSLTISLCISRVCAIRYFELYADNIDYVISANNRRLDKLLLIINRGGEESKASVVELQECIYRRSYLCRRRAEVQERLDQGREALANWNGKGQAFVANDSLERVLGAPLPMNLVRASAQGGDSRGGMLAYM